jgi:pimeloyl-ACP methyl ester carboxylesterase
LKKIRLEKVKNIKISINNAEFNCRVLGNGTKNIIAFHGFGQDSSAFLPLILVRPEYTVYAFDLPFHGNTTISDPSKCITPNDITDLIQKLDMLVDLDRFSLIGFSIGAKLLFPVLDQLSSRVDTVWLLAPDGIKLNNWYQIATSTYFMRGIFRSLLNKPNTVKRFANGLNRLWLIDNRTLKFALSSINSEVNRGRIADCWIYLRKLKVNDKVLAEKVNRNKIEIYFALGEKDTIISKGTISPLRKKIDHSKTIILDAGHQNLIGNFAEWFAKNSN